MDSLVAIGSGASLVYGLFAMFRMAYGFGRGDMAVVHEYAHALYFESAAMILTLVTVGKYLEARSKSKTSQALDKLMDLAPKTAVIIKDGVEIEVPAEQVAAGDIVVVRPGGGNTCGWNCRSGARLCGPGCNNRREHTCGKKSGRFGYLSYNK